MAIAVADLQARFRGQAIVADDPEYEEARRVYNAMIDRRPMVVVRAANAGDVIAAVNLAREEGVPLAIRGGDHSVPGFGTCDGGVVVDLSRMRGVRVEPAKRTARAEGGARWGDFNAATDPYDQFDASGNTLHSGFPLTARNQIPPAETSIGVRLDWTYTPPTGVLGFTINLNEHAVYKAAPVLV